MLKKIRLFFMWNTIINGVVLIISSFLLAYFGEWIMKLQGLFIAMPHKQFHDIAYVFLLLYKVLIFIFNLVPWLALLIVDRNSVSKAS